MSNHDTCAPENAKGTSIGTRAHFRSTYMSVGTNLSFSFPPMHLNLAAVVASTAGASCFLTVSSSNNTPYNYVVR